MAIQETSERVERFLEREREWLAARIESVRALIDRVKSGAEDFDAAEAALARWGHDLENLEREQRGLLAEWAASDLTEEDRQPMRAKAAEVREMVEQCIAQESELRGLLAARGRELGEETAAVRQGQGMLRRYRQSGPVLGDHIDRGA